MQNIFLSSINQGLFPIVLKLLVILLPIFLPIILIIIFLTLRFRYITLKFVTDQKQCLLEVRLPKEITKSPAAMEIFFSYLAFGGAGNWGEAFLDGKTRPWTSCELVSIGGDVRFFVWCSTLKNKSTIETQLYAQYPNIEIYEVDEKDDYTKKFYFDNEKYAMSGVQYEFAKADAYPIKTYIDYGLHENPKDEHKIDPMTPVLEFLGSLKAGNNVWIQILIQKHESESWKHGVLRLEADEKKDGFFKKQMVALLGKSRKLKEEINKEIEDIRKKSIQKTDEENDFKFPNPTKGQNEIIAALERSATKTPFDCMIRSIYIAEKDSFDPVNIGGMIGSLKQYGSNALNAFKPKAKTDISDEQKDLTRILPFLKKGNEEKINKYKRDMLHAYKLRSFFEPPYKHHRGKPFILTTEELATIFHFPSGLVSQTPTLKRVESKKSEAPSNLPI